MKKTLFLSLACLLITFSSCQKTESGENGSTQKQEQVTEDTPESIILAVQDKYSYDSYAETSKELTVFFHEPTPLTLVKEYPEGIKSVTILKEDFLSWTDNKSNLSIKFKDGKEAVLNKFCELDFTCDTATPLSFDKFRETKTVNFSIVQNSEDALSVSVETSTNDFSVEVSVNSDKKGGSISITNNSSIEGETKITITAENGVGRKVKTIEAFYEDFHFVHQAEWCPWNEIDERIDGKTEVELDFDVELSREFVLVMNKVDKNITTSISEDAKEWLFDETKTNATTHFGRLSVAEGQIGISLSKNSEDKYRTGVITITSSKGKQLKITIHQIGEKMPNSMRSNLMAFYNACNGVNWDDNTGWGTKTEIVDWYGIKCMGYVKGNNNKVYSGLYDEWDIEMESNNISGTIPEAFWNIVNKFQTIDLGYNKFTEQKLDERIWQSHLRKLNLASCFAFTGNISPKIENCKNLYYLNLSDNKLSGNIPEEIYNCSELSHFEIGNHYEGNGNKYNTTISRNICKLQKLEWFDINRGGIYGKIPDELYSLKNLTHISLGQNNLEGSLPTIIKNLKGIGFYNISENELTGSLPEEISQIDWTSLSGNHFIGNIPEGIRYTKTAWKVDEVWWLSSQRYKNAPKSLKEDGSSADYWKDELYYTLPMPDWAKERFGTTKWNQLDQKKSKYPYADDLQYPANEYYYDGKDWRHPKYEHPARFYHKVNGEWAYDPDWNWNHTTDPPITEVPEWPGVNR